MQIVDYQPGDTIIAEGDAPEFIYMVCSGSVRVSQQNGAHELAILSKDAIFGDMAMIDNKPRTATVTALEETQCCLIDVPTLRQMMEGIHPMVAMIMSNLTTRLRVMTEAHPQTISQTAPNVMI